MSEERYHVVAARPTKLTPDLVKRVGRAIGVSPFDLRLRWTAALPRSLAVFTDMTTAEAAGRSVADEGVATVVFSEARMTPALPVAVRRWQWLDEATCATDKQGNVAELAYADVVDIVLGRRVVTHMSTNLETRQIMSTDGAMMRHTVVTKQESKELPLFAMLLAEDRARPPLLFDADGLEFQCMPDIHAMSDNAMVLKLIDLITERHPEAAVDRSLMLHRIEPSSHLFYNRRLAIDAAVAVGYVTAMLRRAAGAQQNLLVLE